MYYPKLDTIVREYSCCKCKPNQWIIKDNINEQIDDERFEYSEPLGYGNINIVADAYQYTKRVYLKKTRTCNSVAPLYEIPEVQ
jgi:hypothetical protein